MVTLWLLLRHLTWVVFKLNQWRLNGLIHQLAEHQKLFDDNSEATRDKEKTQFEKTLASIRRSKAAEKINTIMQKHSKCEARTKRLEGYVKSMDEYSGFKTPYAFGLTDMYLGQLVAKTPYIQNLLEMAGF